MTLTELRSWASQMQTRKGQSYDHGHCDFIYQSMPGVVGGEKGGSWVHCIVRFVYRILVVVMGYGYNKKGQAFIGRKLISSKWGYRELEITVFFDWQW